jgi:RNA polymerase sigma factor (sigma-70 family)
MKNLSDAEIIESVKKGNVNDFSILIDKYKNRAFSMLSRMLKNEAEAEEVLQDCFLKAYKGLKGFKQESKFSTWFYRIVYNTALTRLSGKKRKLESEMSSLDDHQELRSSNDYRATEEKDKTELVNNLISMLPANQAAVVNMFYLDNMSCEEISSIMNLSLSNTKVLLYRARNTLKELIMRNNLSEELL